MSAPAVPAACSMVPIGHVAPLAEIGGKALNLARVVKLGAAVPEGFVVTDAALRAFVEFNGLQPVLDAASAACRGTDRPALRSAAESAVASFGRAQLPPVVRRAVLDAWRPISGARVIVRSSAAGEDSEAASFAGQLDSITDVSSEAGLERALVSVWASRWGYRALAYQAAKNSPLPAMGVVVQRQVEASLSGVLFTVAPDAPSDMLLEYCSGMGEALVAGIVDPGRMSIARADFSWRKQASPETVAPGDEILLNAQVSSLAELGLRMERAFGAPQDIEWTIDREGRLWIVQARPITAPSSSVQRRDARLPVETVLWSNANVNENFPHPVSPLLYSIASAGYYHYFRNLGRAFGVSNRRLSRMEGPLREIVGVHGARLYYNLTSIHAVLRSAPFGELLTASFNQFTGAAEAAAPEQDSTFSARARNRLALVGELVTIAAKTAWQYAFVTRRVERFERTVSAFARRTHPDALRERPLPALVDALREFMDIRCNRWNDAALADAASMVCYGILQRLLHRTFPDGDQQALHNTLLKALPNLVSGTPAVALWELSRRIREDPQLLHLFRTATPTDALHSVRTESRFAVFHARFAEYLEHWGFRCSTELMLTTPTFQERPEPLVELLKSYAALEGPSPAEQLQQQEKERLAATTRVREILRRRSWFPGLHLGPAVGLILRWTQTSIQLRERARLKQALLYTRLRFVARAIGARLVVQGRLRHQDDVFFLTWAEIDALASGHAMFPDHVQPLVALRRHAHAELSAMSPPDSMQLAPGEYLQPAGSPKTQEPRDRTPSTTFTGAGACGGSKTARAAVLADVTEADRINRGDILVTRQTDPGWGPVFPLISGLIIERGGMLSHGAIIAREFGIPSVVGVKDATRRIPHGALVTVDGDRGVVRLEREGAAC